MKFNSYLVELDHRDNALTGHFLIHDQTVYVNLKRITKSLFVAHFKSQVQLLFQERIPFKKRNKSVLVLLPMLSKYNKRKLTKLSKWILDADERNPDCFVFNLLQVEKFLKTERLLGFFNISREDMQQTLINWEFTGKVKIIEFISLTITSMESYRHYQNLLTDTIEGQITGQRRVLKTSDLEASLKIPRTSLFFKYLLRSVGEKQAFSVQKEHLIFHKMNASSQDRETMTLIEKLLRKNHATLFSVDETLKYSGMNYQEVNDALWFFLEEGHIVQLNEQYYMFADELNKILNRLKKFKRNTDEVLEIQSLREMTLFNRKKLIVLLEYFDAQRITRRFGNKRKILLGV